MNSQVGPTGEVTAVDNNARFLRDLGHNVHVVDGDISCAPLPAGHFDFSADVINVECACPVEPGGSMLAEMMRLSTLALENKYVATGCATSTDIARYAEFAESPDCWGIYYATVRVVARKRAE